MSKGQRDGHGIYQYADGGRYEGGWEGMLGYFLVGFSKPQARIQHARLTSSILS